MSALDQALNLLDQAIKQIQDRDALIATLMARQDVNHES